MDATACTLSASKSYCLDLNTPPPRPITEDPPATPHCSNHLTTTTSSSSPPPSSAPKERTSTTSSTQSTPSPVQAGISTACTSFYKVLKNDTCVGIGQGQKLALPDLYAWNPALRGDCSGLQANTYICVAGPGKATASTTGQHTPTPVQTGMVVKCKRFYKVKRDEGCWDIAHNANIGLQEFYEWNPAVKKDCSGLQADVYVCVGI